MTTLITKVEIECIKLVLPSAFLKKKILYRIQYILSNHVHTPYIQGLLEKLTDKVIYRKILCVLYDDVCFIKHMILKRYIEFYFA